ncbi:hypothetical protein LSCM4_07503 [Leishmania orientalis]|uniref:Uncharacterized protein n=1 Tax=Leishmania orientalis TaxID=2249476 RepID=A0A836I3Q7_9TRYP|nr:hypothetical protein LSCM4_07503 [Leishmania orientalis]
MLGLVEAVPVPYASTRVCNKATAITGSTADVRATSLPAVGGGGRTCFCSCLCAHT